MKIVLLIIILALLFILKDERKKRKEAEKNAITDQLTGLYNRRFFLQKLAEEVERAQRHGVSLELLFIDIDNFKQVNDRYGHKTGDKLMIKFARMLKKNMRRSDSFCRWSGDEFMALLPESSPSSAKKIRQRLSAEIKKIKIDGNSLDFIDVSIGISKLNPVLAAGMNAKELEKELIKLADEDMYVGKMIKKMAASGCG